MDDSDEYFDDSFVLDEQALARIEEIEIGFISAQPSTTPDLPHSSHNAIHKAVPSVSHKSTKQTKLKNTPTTVSRTIDPFEDGPLDINVRIGPNGTYVFSGEGHEHAGFDNEKPVQMDGGEKAKPAANLSPGRRDFETELSDLRAQLLKLKESNDAMRQSLREAQEAQLVKSGEVAMLRNAVDKQKQEYSNVVSKAKAERLTFEKTKAEFQAKLKEETDKLATSFAFRLQELQTSTRKQVRSSAHSIKVAKNRQYDGTETPLRASRPFKTSSAKENVDNDSDQEAALSSPSHSFLNGHRGLEKKARFKGFQNSFTQSVPVSKSPVKRVHNPFSPPPARSKIPEQDTLIREDDRMLIDQENDVLESPLREFAAEVPPDMSSAEVKVDPIEEFQRAVFSHVAPGCDDLSLHSLLSVTFPTGTKPGLMQAYTSACNILLECCSTATLNYPYFQRSWENIAGKIAGTFVILGSILFHANILDRLLVLLDLLLQLTLAIPSVSIHFLRPPINPLPEDFPDLDQKNLMSLFCDIIQTHLIPPLGSPHFGKRHSTHALQYNLTITILNLLGSLYWHGAGGDLISNYSIVFKSGALQTLLSVSQGQAVIKRTLRLLILWASDPGLIGLFQHHGVSLNEIPSEAGLISIIYQLSIFLTDIVDPQLYDLLRLTFVLINTLNGIHQDIRSSLLESLHLLPSAIICITTLTRALWEEKPEIVSKSEIADSALDLLFIAVSSLHHLLFSPETYSNFSFQLMKSTGISRKFNGVVHMFIVTFGRLSWAEIPEWLPPKGRFLCESISELSMELIETVVPGPECDSLWSVWHESDSMED